MKEPSRSVSCTSCSFLLSSVQHLLPFSDARPCKLSTPWTADPLESWPFNPFGHVLHLALAWALRLAWKGSPVAAALLNSTVDVTQWRFLRLLQTFLPRGPLRSATTWTHQFVRYFLGYFVAKLGYIPCTKKAARADGSH